MGKVKTWEVLKKLGFEALADIVPAYNYNLLNKFGKLEERAIQVTSLYFRPVYLFTGNAMDGRTIRIIDFEMPLEVESFEQGVAWIVNKIGKDLSLQLRPP